MSWSQIVGGILHTDLISRKNNCRLRYKVPKRLRDQPHGGLTLKIPQNPKWVVGTLDKLLELEFLIFFDALFYSRFNKS
jgi:hypothetical protein